MSRWSPEPKNGLTPINEAITSAEVESNLETSKRNVTPNILVKEGSATSFLSETSSHETDQNNRPSSGNSIHPIVASATQIHPGQKKTDSFLSGSKSNRLKYGLIALGVVFIIIVIVVLACIPLYLPKKTTTTATDSKLIRYFYGQSFLRIFLQVLY